MKVDEKYITPVPWEVCSSGEWVQSAEHGGVFHGSAITVKERMANAKFCVVAVNSHETLKEALRFCEEHLEELRNAWQRGYISEHDTHGGTRSNRNMDVLVEVRAALQGANITDAHK